ncbi:MAG: heme ABC transporter permease [Pseudomonadota bacterium]
MNLWSFTHRLSNPTRFLELSGAILPWLAGLAAAVLVTGLAMGWAAPADYQQGNTILIMYIHVPSAWLAMMGYAVIAVSSFAFLVFRHPMADVSAKAAAPIGAAFTILALVTGSLWGKPMWGTYWVWDARLTSVLILFFLYLGLMALRASIEEDTLASKLTAVLGLVGVAILPFIRISVEGLELPGLGISIPAWNTLHQPASVLRLDGPTIHASQLIPLLVSGLGFMLLFFAMHTKAMRNEVLRRRVNMLRLRQVRRAQNLNAQKLNTVSYRDFADGVPTASASAANAGGGQLTPGRA